MATGAPTKKSRMAALLIILIVLVAAASSVTYVLTRNYDFSHPLFSTVTTAITETTSTTQVAAYYITETVITTSLVPGAQMFVGIIIQVTQNGGCLLFQQIQRPGLAVGNIIYYYLNNLPSSYSVNRNQYVTIYGYVEPLEYQGCAGRNPVIYVQSVS